MSELVLTVSEFVAVLNQTLEYAYPSVSIVGELANFRVSKNRWVYFDLKDETASVKFFGTVYQLPGPLEDGITVEVKGQPRLHNLYGFSVNVQSLRPVGQGSIKRASQLLEAKLAKEGLFDPDRKRLLPYPPERIGLITSGQSAAYADFIKILNERWGGLEINLADVQVQGEAAVSQIVSAIQYFNQHAEPPDVLVVTRGGGSADDLQAFSTEQVTRAIAASRIPTLVAIGHEVDLSLAERAADQRASTPSNAAQLLVPDKRYELAKLSQLSESLYSLVQQSYELMGKRYEEIQNVLNERTSYLITQAIKNQALKLLILQAFDPASVLKRGYAVVRTHGQVIRSAKKLNAGQELAIQFAEGSAEVSVKNIDGKKAD